MSFMDDFNKQVKDPKQAALFTLGMQEYQKSGNMANPAWLLFFNKLRQDRKKKEK